MASFAAQNRAVTKEDYIIRAYSLPQKYGSIPKAYITKDTHGQLTNYYTKKISKSNDKINKFTGKIENLKN